MNVRFLTLAQQEVDEAFQWFEEKAEGKGLEFPFFVLLLSWVRIPSGDIHGDS